MPELPEVETVRIGLAPIFENAAILAVDQRRPDLRFPFPDRFAERLTGRTVVALGRRAKYLTADLDDGAVLVMHLGMSGSFRIGVDVTGAFHHERSKLARHDHVVFSLARDGLVTYNDPRRFGFMTLVERAAFDAHPLFAHLGVEPLGNRLDPDYLADRFAGRAVTLKTALLDQRIVAGLGNIYVSEALWRARLSPRRSAASLVGANGRAGRRLADLAAAIRSVIADAIAAGGSSLRDYVRADGSLGYFQHAFAVYDRTGGRCARPGCAGTVQRIVQNARSTFLCPACQR